MKRSTEILAGSALALTVGTGLYFYEQRHAATSQVTKTRRQTVPRTQRATLRQTATHTVTVHSTASAKSAEQLTLTVNGSQFHVLEAVAITLLASAPITSQGGILRIVDTSTGHVIQAVSYGDHLTATITHAQAVTRQYVGQWVLNGQVAAQSNPVTVTWLASANGDTSGRPNAAGGTVALAVHPYTQIGKPGLMMHLQPSTTGITNPIFEYWWLPPGGAWASSGGYRNQPNFYLDANINGTWSFTVYATDATAPHPETTAQRMIYEAKSSTITMAVTGATYTPKQYTNRTQGSVTASVPATATPGQTIIIQAQTTGITNPVYQYWWETPSGQWQSDGVYRTTNQWPVALNSMGTWHVVVIARPSSAPINEDAQQRALYEVSSPTYSVTVKS